MADKEFEELDNEYEDAVDGDIYLNPCFGDLWIVQDKQFIKINDGYLIDLVSLRDLLKLAMLKE